MTGALARVYHVSDQQNKMAIPAVFSRRVVDRNEAQRLGEWVPMKQPVGLAVQESPKCSALLVTDAASKQIWRTPLNVGKSDAREQVASGGDRGRSFARADGYCSVAVFGEGDKAGDDAKHVNAPSFVAMQGTRAVAADSGNQRLIRLGVNGVFLVSVLRT
ncbi:MAG: hypothetical protein NTW87_10795 [Planctomycetota bacterium]|nr:hypothetical protein [Planctomycetota bacterium]